MFIETSPEQLFNTTDLSLKITNPICLVFLYETCTQEMFDNITETREDNTPNKVKIKRQLMRNIEAYAAIRKTFYSCRYDIYSVNVISYSDLDEKIKNKKSLLYFQQYPQLILYINGLPLKYMNGRITDKTTLALSFSMLNCVIEKYKFDMKESMPLVEFSTDNMEKPNSVKDTNDKTSIFDIQDENYDGADEEEMYNKDLVDMNGEIKKEQSLFDYINSSRKN